ncbi:reverse transcriptase domain-containing protein [Tanacetum coccineum]
MKINPSATPRVSALVGADQLLHHEVEGRVDGLVEEMEELENQRAELVDELVIEMVKEVTKLTKRIKELSKYLTSPRSSLSNFKTIIAQVGNHVNNQGNNRNRNDNVVNDNIQGDVRNVNVNNSQGRCSYKEFLACNLKDFDGKGSAIAYTCWTEKMESVQDMSGCGDHQKVKYIADSLIDFKALMREEFCPNNEMQKLELEFWCHAMVEAGHAAYTDRFHELARLVSHLVTLENKRIERYIYGLAPLIHEMVAAIEPTTIQSAILKVRVLTDEAIRNGSLRKNTEKRGNGGESSKDGNVKDDNKRSRTGRKFATTTNPVREEYTGLATKGTNCNFYHHPEMPCCMCMNYNRLGHFTKDCRVGPRMVNPLNARNSIAAHGVCFECGGTGHYKASCPRLNRAPGQ